MKVAVVSESPADEAAISILVSGTLGHEIESYPMPVRSGRGFGVLKNIPSLVKSLHYHHTDVEGFVFVVDSDDTRVTDEQGHHNRLAQARQAIDHTTQHLTPVSGRQPLKTAVGLAVPAIEAWWLCGKSGPEGAESTWLQVQNRQIGGGREYRNRLKTLVYGTDRPSLELMTQHMATEATRVAQDLDSFRKSFPIGFGALHDALSDW